MSRKHTRRPTLSGPIRLSILIGVVLLCWFIGTGSLRAQDSDRMSLREFTEKRVELRATANRIQQRKCRSPVHGFSKPARQVRFRVWNLNHWRHHVRVARALKSRCGVTPWYVTKQIGAGNVLGRESAGDPWPNCPDPWDGSGSSWQGTVNCENGGSWLDSPGFYRCGLQFHPNWENRFGRLCP